MVKSKISLDVNLVVAVTVISLIAIVALSICVICSNRRRHHQHPPTCPPCDCICECPSFRAQCNCEFDEKQEEAEESYKHQEGDKPDKIYRYRFRNGESVTKDKIEKFSAVGNASIVLLPEGTSKWSINLQGLNNKSLELDGLAEYYREGSKIIFGDATDPDLTEFLESFLNKKGESEHGVAHAANDNKKMSFTSSLDKNPLRFNFNLKS